MDNKKDIEKLVDDFMEVDAMDTPSLNFTAQVLEKLSVHDQKKFVYKPLMPKWVLSIAVILVFGFLCFGVNQYITGGTTSNLFAKVGDMGQWTSNFISKFQISKTLAYAISIAGILVCFHALVLKRFFENRLVQN